MQYHRFLERVSAKAIKVREDNKISVIITSHMTHRETRLPEAWTIGE